MNKNHIIIVEDDAIISNFIGTALEMNNYNYLKASNGKTAIMETLTHRPDVMLLDLGLPDMSGIEVIKKTREWSNMPIIVVSARAEDKDKVEALDAGADDYLTKPFSVEELLARIRVAIRRANFEKLVVPEAQDNYENGDICIDYSAGCLYLAGEEIHLTPMEYKLLCLLARNTGKVISHNQILRDVWGGVNESDMASMRVCMTMLRHKLGASAELIQTHVGVGYRMLWK